MFLLVVTDRTAQDNFWVETSVKMKLSCDVSMYSYTGHHGEHTFLLRFNTNQFF